VDGGERRGRFLLDVALHAALHAATRDHAYPHRQSRSVTPTSSTTGPTPAAQPTPPVSAAERTLAARVGAVLFRNRGWLPLLFLGVPLLAPGSTSPTRWMIGALLIVAGEAIRLAGVAAAGTVTRRRSRAVQRLVTYGPFAWSRNPLYNGNFLIWMGFVVISGVLWFLPLAVVIFAIEYTLIVRYEEGVLESIFGDEYLAYKRRTPRWIPRPPGAKGAASGDEEYSWPEAWRSEISTFLQYAALVAAFVVKDRLT
jgi:protein-S-isoprenylcysteine O-methyltransferase Ste14